MSDLPPHPSSSEPPVYQVPPGDVPVPIQYPRTPYPTSGFQVPDGVPGYDMTAMGADPLVTPPGEGFSGWWMRLWKVFGRSWGALLPIVGLTSGLPGIAFALVVQRRLDTMTEQLHAFQLAQQQDPSALLPADFQSNLAAFYGYLGAYLLVYLIFSAVGWTASIWTITKHAAGEPAPFGRAIVYGLKEFPRTFGWLIVYFLMIAVGSVCCLLPGLYFAVAGSLIVPLVVFSRASISESFRMVNRNFGGVLGRVLTLYAFDLAVTIVVLIASQVVGGAGAGTIYSTALQIVGVILAIPMTSVLIIGITLTFAEMRAREMPTTTQALNQAL